MIVNKLRQLLDEMQEGERPKHFELGRKAWLHLCDEANPHDFHHALIGDGPMGSITSYLGIPVCVFGRNDVPTQYYAALIVYGDDKPRVAR